MITEHSLLHFTRNVFLMMGCSGEHAGEAARILVKADMRGIYSHGVNRLQEYINLWKNKRVNIHPEMKIVRELPSTALIDANKSFGLVSAPYAMRLAIRKAKQSGAAWVSVRNSYHFGIAGYYAMMALEQDMIGIAMTNANPLVAPTHSTQAALGTNPFAIAIPAMNEPAFVADMATAPINRGKLDAWAANNVDVPPGLVQDSKGMDSTDPEILSKKGAIKTLGQDETHGGHKGYCMSATVDILSAVLSGANFGPLVVPTLQYIRPNSETEDRGSGHLFGAIRIDGFQEAEVFKKYMDEWIKTFKALPAKDGKRVLIPGEPERIKETEQAKTGLRLPDYVLQKLSHIAGEFQLHPDFL